MYLSIKTHTLKLVIVLSGIYLPLHIGLLARAQTNNQTARKFDEFGDIYYSDKIARLDNFAIQLQNEPSTRGFVIVYRTRRDLPGLSNRYALWMKNYLIMRGLPAARVVTVDGGEADCLTQELWIVAVGATPATRNDAYSRSFIDTDSARKFDEHYYSLPADVDDGDWFGASGDLATYLDAFATALQKEPRAQAYIIAYAQYSIEREVVNDASEGRKKSYKRVNLDPPGTALKMLKKERAYLIKTYRIAPSRIKVVDGGYRKLRQVELWIVPRGAYAPRATPNQFPRRRKASSR